MRRQMKIASPHNLAIGRDPAVRAPRDLQDFAGNWRLSRQIHDRRLAAEGRMEGEASFVADAAGLVYDESGLLHFGGGAPLRSSRRYLWRPAGAGRVTVLFDDGRPFHDFALGAAAAADHHCAPDFYAVSYDFAGWPHWRAVWRVAGPRKDYVSVTDYAPPG